MLSLFGGRLQKARSASGIVLPQENLLVVYEFCTLRIDDLAPEMLILKEIQKVQAHRILQVFSIFWLLPVEQVLEVVYEG